MSLNHSPSRYSQFRFDAGSPALNFVATVRHRGAKPRDLLPTPEALARWFSLAGYGNIMLQPSARDLEEALILREAIHGGARSLIVYETPRAQDLNIINTAAAHSLAVPQMDVTTCAVRWESPHPARAYLAEIARDAIRIIGHEGRNRLKRCDNRSCEMLFLDLSPAHRRRWCAMSICGNRNKVKMHRRRKNGG